MDAFNVDGTRKGLFTTLEAAQAYMAELDALGIPYSFYRESATRFWVKKLA